MPPTQPFDPVACALGELTAHIRDTHHAYLRAELPAIWELLREAVAETRARGEEVRLFARLFGQFRSILENHLRKEEEVLFPFIEQLDRTCGAGDAPPRYTFGSLALPIEILEAEHALGDRLLDRMRTMWQQWAAPSEIPAWRPRLHDRLLQLDADMQRHVQIEDAILFPRTIRLEIGR